MNLIPLNQLAELRLGYPFKSRLESSANASVRVIQMRDLDADCGIAPADLVGVNEYPTSKHYVRQGDALFRNRSKRLFDATLIDIELDSVIAASPLIILTPNQQKVLPGYLNWFLNQEQAQNYFQSNATGSAVRMVGKKALGELPVRLPSLARQTSIVQLAVLTAKEQKILKQISRKRKQCMEGILMQLASGSQ